MTRPEPVHFGTDGWRGIMAEDFTFANVRRVVAATADYVRTHPLSQSESFLIGYDRRFFSREFAQTVAQVLTARGLRVQLSQTPMPTPALSALVVARRARLRLQSRR